MGSYDCVLSGLKLVLQADSDRNKLRIAVSWFNRLYYDIAKFDSEIVRIVKACPLQFEGYSERELYNWYMLMEEVWDAIVNPRAYKKGEPPLENAEVFKLANEMCVRIKALEKRMERDFTWLKNQDPALFARLVDTVGFFIDTRAGILSIAKEVAGMHLYDNILSERYRYRPPGSNSWQEWRWSIPEEKLTEFLRSLKPLDTDQVNFILANVKNYVEIYEQRAKSLSQEMKDVLENASFEFLTIEEYDQILKEREDEGSNIVLNIGEMVVAKNVASTEVREERGEKTKSTILFLAADPTDATHLRLGQELREIQERLQLARLREQFRLESRMSIRPADISQALLDVRPQIVHFSGHGTPDGKLCFENLIGETHPIAPDTLSALFEQFADQVTCVVLNACYSKIQANAISKHINYVIGMDQAIGDKAAIAFALGFYQALGGDRTIEDAYNLGCVQIRLEGIPEHLTPILIKKRQLQP
jgi:hypothetical protein